MYCCAQGKYYVKYSVELDDLEYAVNNMKAKNTLKRVSAVEGKSAKQCVCGVNVEDYSQTLAVFLSFRIYAGNCQTGGGGRWGQC